MWLDRGEMERLLDLAEARSPEPAVQRRPAPETFDRRPSDPRYERWDDRDEPRPKSKKKKRKSAFAELLEEVFDFD